MHHRIQLAKLPVAVVPVAQRRAGPEPAEPAELVLAQNADAARFAGIEVLGPLELGALVVGGPFRPHNEHRRPDGNIAGRLAAETSDQRLRLQAADRRQLAGKGHGLTDEPMSVGNAVFGRRRRRHSAISIESSRCEVAIDGNDAPGRRRGRYKDVARLVRGRRGGARAACRATVHDARIRRAGRDGRRVSARQWVERTA